MKNLMPVVAALAALGTQADAIGRATGTARITAVMGVFPILLPLAKVDFDEAKKELKAATPEQKQEIKTALESGFDIADDALESVIENGLQFITSAYSVVLSGMDLFADIKNLRDSKQAQIEAPNA